LVLTFVTVQVHMATVAPSALPFLSQEPPGTGLGPGP
jgi:hypothetical protein